MANRKSNPKTKRESPAGTRERLLAAAIRLFSQKGYDGTSVDEIVAEARANKRMVYHYFGSKEAIYHEVLREVYGRLMNIELALVDPEAPMEQALEALVRAYFAFLAANPEFVQLLLWENLSRGRHLGSAGDALSKAPILGVLHQALQRGVREERIAAGFDTKHLLINLIGLCLIYFSNRYTLSRSVGLDLRSPQVLREGINQVLRLVKHGILESPPKIHSRPGRVAEH
jgi:AcrR family transcriptional regulator